MGPLLHLFFAIFEGVAKSSTSLALEETSLPERLPLPRDEGPRERLPVGLLLQSCFPEERKLERVRQADLRDTYDRAKLAGQDHRDS